MEIRLLGPLEVCDGGNTLALPRRQQRALLAALALRAGEVVSTDRLVADLWGERAPASATGSLQNTVSALRKLVGRDVLITQAPGYRLAVDTDSVDANRFERLLESARDARPAARAELLRDALALWRGPALADLDEEDFARLEAARLDELRVTAHEDRVDAELELGRHAALVGELETLVRTHPLRERLRGQLMLALYRCGRQAEALEVYRATRLALMDELGLTPSRQLRELERRLLRQDPNLWPPGDLDGRPAGRATPPVSVIVGDSDVTIVGRASELTTIDALLAAAARGRSSTLIIRGEPGIGKSTLLSYAGARAAGATVLRARGIESQSELGFAGLAAVLQPIVDAASRLPAQQAGALIGALGLGPPIPADPFAVSVATMNLLSVAAEQGPVVVLVDDAQWLDAPSQQALVFAARRLDAEGVALLIAVRSDERTPFDSTELSMLTVEGLSPAEAETLLSQSSFQLSPRGRRAVLEAADGNPLALVELPQLLSDAEREGRADPVPLPAGEAIENAFRHRLANLTGDERQALLVAAADDTGYPQIIQDAARALGVPDAALEGAEARGVIMLGADVRFRHPLLRSLVYHSASPPERRRAHAAIADALASHDFDSRAAWHRALAATRADPTLADQLDATAADFRARGAFSAAAASGEHAARLTPQRELRARRLASTASDAQLSGKPEHAESLLTQSLELTDDPLVRAEAQSLRARGLLFSGRPLDAHALLVDEADRIEAFDRQQAALLLCQAVPPCSMAGAIDRGLRTGRRAVELAADADQTTQALAELALAQILHLTGDAKGAEHLRDRAHDHAHLDDPRTLLELNQVEAGHLMVLGEHEAARTSVDHLIALGRAASAPALMPFALATRAEIDFRTGHWAQAAAEATEAIELSRQTGQPAHTAYALMIHGRILAARGLATEATAALTEADAIGRLGGIGALLFFIPAARAFGAMSQGDLEAAASAGLEIEAISRERGLGEPGVVLWPPDLIEALVGLDRRDEAGRTLLSFEAQAESTGRGWALATAARCRGLLASEHDFETEFAAAIDRHERLDMPFERARTDLCLGERRAAAGRTREAVGSLRLALATFERLGAHPWTARTAIALAALGEPIRRAEQPIADMLTERELRIALVLADGAPASEAATQLFLSQRTVESHARALYGKLGVASPEELRLRLTPGP